MMTIAELGAVLGVTLAIGGVVWRASMAIAATERRLEAAILQIRIDSIPKAEWDYMKRRHRAVEGFLVKHFSVDLDRYEMD